jgi:integrase/recombinase XerD
MVFLLRSFVRGPLEPYVSGFADELGRFGYTRCSLEQHVCFIAHLDRWLAAERLGVGDMSAAAVDRYLCERRAAGYVNYRSMKAMRPLLSYLDQLGLLPAAEVAVGPVPDLLERYRAYLISERGLTPGTARCYLDAIRPFVTSRLRGGELDLAGLTAADVTGFVLAACPGRAQGTAKLIVTTLRSLLIFLHIEGVIAAPLAAAVPSVAGWRLAGLPRALEPEQLRRLLASCDRRRRLGRRDYAILLLLSRLGLRAGEVAALGLDDVDWRSGEITVVGKGNRAERLPLPADVGAAIVAYLRHGRPATAQGRSVFVRAKAPHLALTTAGVSMVVHDAAQRAGLGLMHAHRLRHTAATQMLRAGTPLTEVGLVLRQRRALTTAIYAKVDRDGLQVLARPWPQPWPWPKSSVDGRS